MDNLYPLSPVNSRSRVVDSGDMVESGSIFSERSEPVVLIDLDLDKYFFLMDGSELL